MGFFGRLKVLLQERKFRQLVYVRVATQSGDGTLQIAMASYILFSPEKQTSAWAIAMVLAITLLPFTIIEPFVSVFLDRWSRRQIVMVCDTIRAAVSLTLSALVFTGNSSFWFQMLLFALLLVVNALNRFLLTGLNAGLPHAVDQNSYLTANSVLPLIGPFGLLLGGVVAVGIRFILGPIISTHRADSLSLFLATFFFLTSIFQASRVGKYDWGPSQDTRTQERSSSVGRAIGKALGEFKEALGHIGARSHMSLGMTLVAITRILFGMLSVAMILATRNLFRDVSEANASLLDMGIWSAATGIGYVIGPWILNPVSSKLRIRNTLVVFFVFGSVIQLFPGLFFQLIPQVITGLGIGIVSQNIRIMVDTMLQGHCDDAFRGRVFVFYDIIYNGTFALSGVIAAFVISPQGLTVPYVVGLAIAYLLGGVLAWIAGNRLGPASFDKGTHFGEVTGSESSS